MEPIGYDINFVQEYCLKWFEIINHFKLMKKIKPESIQAVTIEYSGFNIKCRNNYNAFSYENCTFGEKNLVFRAVGIELCALIKISQDFIHYKGDAFLEKFERNKTKVECTKSNLTVYWDGLKILLLSKTYTFTFNHRFDFGAYANCFTIFPNSVKDEGHYSNAIHHSEYIKVHPKTDPDEWDSVAFQNSTVYDGELSSLLMLEPFVSPIISEEKKACSAKIYCVSNSWVDLPFTEIWEDLFCLFNKIG